MDTILSYYILLFVCSLLQGSISSVQNVDDSMIASKVYYADVVAVGNVTSIQEENDAQGTYDAEVEIQCSYKGGVLPYKLTIKGVIQDVCGLTVNSKHILFLTRKQLEANYIQTDAAEPYSKLGELIRVCDLDRNYPEKNSVTVKQRLCPPTTQLSSCEVQRADYRGEVNNSTQTSCTQVSSNTASRQMLGTTVFIIMYMVAILTTLKF